MSDTMNKMQGPPPGQEQERQPGREYKMKPRPASAARHYKAAGKLAGQSALITGGDSGIGRAVASCFAQEGCDVSIVFLEETRDALETRSLVEEAGRKCACIAGDIGDPEFCRRVIEDHVNEHGGLDILVNNAAEQHVAENFEDITDEQLHRTFQTNLFSMFYLTRAALAHMQEGSCIINTTSVTAYQGHPVLIDYASTKGAIVAFTRSLSSALASRNIRVNAVAPGPIWTPLIPASFSKEKVATFGEDTPMGRPGQPDEVGPSYVFLASEDSSYMTGQVLHPNGGRIVNG